MNKILKETFSWIKIIILALILSLIINRFILVNAYVPSGSMESTIMTKDRLIAFRLSYLFSQPQRFDIVVFKNPDNESELFIKRIIGLPNDTIEIIDSTLYINSELIKEDYINEPMISVNDMEFLVPEDHYFMMGDNRNHSLDSRYWDNTYVKSDKIIGKAIFRYFKGFKVF